MFSPVQKRCYGRCLLGLKKAKVLDKPVRFLTLTTPACNGEGLSSEDKKVLIQNQWRRLYKLIKKYYGDYPYFSVRTPEGNGVLHVVFYGDNNYIPFEWLMERWVEINGSCFVWICDPYKYNNSVFDVARYFVSQYIGSQPDFTYGFSQDWVYGGFSKDIVECKRACRKWSEGYRNDYGVWCYPVDYRRMRALWDLYLPRRLVDPGFVFWMVPSVLVDSVLDESQEVLNV